MSKPYQKLKKSNTLNIAEIEDQIENDEKME